MNPRALIVDDIQAECTLIADALTSSGFEPHWVLSGSEGIDVLAQRPFDVVVTDLNMPDMSGIELCRRITETCPHLPVVVVTAFGSIDTAVDAMKVGAYDFITKPFDIDSVVMVLRRAVEHHALRWELDALRRVVDSSKRFGELLGTSQAMRNLYNLIECISDNDAAVLITGESGTGKELVARELHQRGKNPAGPFIAVNCAAMPEAILENDLFGETLDASMDACHSKEGLLIEASGGTLVLDEIGDLPIRLQARLLSVLQERLVRPTGSTREVPLNARIIATTNRDLESAIQSGLFREDLYYRINVIHVEVPPLRARAGDVLFLAQSFLSEIGVRNRKAVSGFSTRAAGQLLSYDWPGNVRELRNCIERAVALAPAELVEIEHLPTKIRDYQMRHVLIAGDDPSELPSLESMERRYILRVVELCQGNKSKAARVLGIGRKTLYRKLEDFGISVSEDEA